MEPRKVSVIRQMLARKSVAQIQQEAASSELKRTLGKWNLLFLGVGCIIGAGIFVRTGHAAALHAGPAMLLSFLVAAIVCAFAGLCYAELASTLPVSGSAYTYSYTTMGEFAAWIMGTLLLLEYGLAAAVVAAGWGGYVGSLLADFGVSVPAQFTGPAGHVLMRNGAPVLVDGEPVVTLFNLPAFLICVALSVFLVRGVAESARLNNIFVVLKVGVLTAFIVVGGLIALSNLPVLVETNWTPFIPENQGDGAFGVSGIMRAASIVFFAYLGFEVVSTAGQESRNPQRDMPFGIIGSLIVCTVVYMAVGAIMTLLVPYSALNVPDPVAVLVDAFGPDWGWFAKVIKVGAILGLTSVVLVLIYGQTRIFYTMSCNGLLPRLFSQVHPAYKTPHLNTLLVGTATGLVAGFFDINTLADMTSVGTLAAFVIVCLSVMYLRRTAPDLPRGFSVPLYPIVPVLGILSCSYLMTTVPGHVLMYCLWYVLGGIVLYFVYGLRHSSLARQRR